MSENYSIVTDVNAGNSMAVLDQIINKIQQVDSAIGKASGQKLQIDASGSNNVLSGLTGQLSGSKGNFANVGRELGQSLQMGMQQQFGMAGGVATSFAGALGGVGIAAVAGLAGLAALGAASTQAAMKWEDMKTSIGRTTGLKGDNLEELMSQLQDLRQEFGVTAEAASSMVEQAGSIGVGQSKLSVGDMSGYKQEILDFTKATAILQGAWGMSAEATSSGIGKMGSVTLGAWNIQRKARGEEEMSWADYAYKVGGTTDNLANAMGSSEEEIVTAMRNSSGAIAKWAPSEDTYGKWQAMASFLIDTGDSAGEAGTKIERVSQKMEQNSADVAKLMGLDQAGLNTKLKTDFMGTVQELGKSIAAMPASERPDLFKMFGLEGASLIGKVIADVEAGTGKLQSAIDLALKPGNVAAGYEDVADNASKAFDRIGQAFQVSLEKIGGQLLPLVADFANGIADAWVGANKAGTEFFDDMQKKLKSSDSIIGAGGGLTDAFAAFFGGQISEESLRKIEDFEKQKAEREAKAAADAEAAAKAETARRQAEYEQTTQYGIGEKALSGASFAGASYKDLGVKSGIGYVDALSNELNSALPSAFTDAYLKVYDVAGRAGKEAAKSFAEEMGKSDALYDELTKAKVSKEIASARAYGGVASDEDALAMINASGRTVKADQILSSTSMGLPGLDEYVQNTWLEYHGGRSDTMTAFFDSTGKQLSETFKGFTEEERDAAYDSFVKGIQPGIRDSAKYFKSHASEFSDTVASIWEDGAISGTEKLSAEGMLKSLEMLEIKYPIEFEAANLDEVKSQLEATVKDGIDVRVNLDKEELAIGIAEYINENFALHTKMLAAGQPPMAANETSYFNLMQKYQDQGDTKTVELLNEIDDIIAEGNYQDGNTAAVLEEKLNYVVKSHPEIAQQTAFQQRIATANNDLVSQYGISTGHLLQIKTSTESTSTSSKNTETNTEKTATGIYEVRDILLAGGFGNTVYNTYNSNSVQSNAASGRWSSSAAWASDYGMGSTWGTAVKGATLDKTKLQNILANATYQEGGITGQEGLGWLHANEIVIPSGALPCAISSQYQMLENPALFKQDTISSSSTGQVWDAHDLGYNIKSVSNNLNDLNGCVSSATQVFQEQNAAALFFQTGGIYPTAQKLTTLSKNLDVVNAQYQQQIPVQYAAIQGANDVSDSFTWVSDLFWDKDMYDRLVISPPTSGYQSSAKRGQVPVDISEAAKAGMGFRNPFTDQTASDYFGMAYRIFAMQQQYSGKSQVMPAGAHEEPQWAVDASKGVITKQSHGVLNPMAVEYDTLQAVNTAKVRYADLLGTELRNTLLLSDASLNASAAGGQYCEAMSQMGIMTEEAARKAEKNGQFYKGYIGPTKDYEAAKAYFASETVPTIEKNTQKLDYWGNSVTKFGDAVNENTKAQKDVIGGVKQTSDILSSGTTAKALSWSLTEFDTYIQSAESGLNSCIQSLSDWAIYQESVLAMPTDVGGMGFFKQESLGGFEKLYPQWGPFATEAHARGMPGPWGGDAEKTAGYITGADGVKQALDGSQLSRIMSSAAASSKDTAKNTNQMVDKITDLNGNLIATRDAYGNVMSDLISGAYGSGGAAWGARGAAYGGSYGSFFGGWSGGGVGSGSTSSGWGASASSGQTGSFGGSQGYGSVQWAEGGITDRPTYGVFGEAGREAFVPISDRAAGLRILPQVMRELGVRTFASGGIAGSGSGIVATGYKFGDSPSIIYSPTINGVGISMDELQMVLERDHKKLLKAVAKKDILARRRRG
ncbi:hypothetical protein M0R72_21140 [Candidatus Pacearchaeota archaeon]|jgi:hypothetical protein|nr:hypothetical protein [Candidatus Pacearchaeota archaeon]